MPRQSGGYFNAINMSPVKEHAVVLKGGLDQRTPTLALPPGRVRDALNFDVEVTGGYTRVDGYERLDGQAAPSDASFSIVQVVSFTNTPTTGQTLTGVTTGATGIIVAIASNYLVVTNVLVGFSDIEVVQVGATVIGTATQQTVSISALLYAQYLNDAADHYRSLIGAVPGSGAIQGVVAWNIGGTLKRFAFRNNAGGTYTDIYQTSGAGWVQVPLFNEVSFTLGGTTAPAEGTTLTQGANTATIKRVVLESGSWASTTAAGRFIVTTPAPGNFSAGAATIGALTCTLSGAQTTITIPVDGTYEFALGNFSGQAATRRVYGVNGVGYAFEFDGEIFVPIHTGFSPDTPNHIEIHRNYLFVGIGSSVANSGVGLPYNWTAAAGAAEIAVSDTVTGMKVQPGAQTTPTLLITCRNSIFMLYGTSASGTNPWALVTYNTDTGGMSRTLQNLDQTYMLDDRGVVSLKTAQEFGNFTQATYTHTIQNFINEHRNRAIASSLNKDRSQYRLFFSTGDVLYITMVNGKLLGCMPMFFTHAPTCAWQTEDVDGSPVGYFGGANGYVYQMDKGSSFDGDNIAARLILNVDSIGSPRLLKRYRRASLEIQGDSYAAFQFGYTLGYGSTTIGQPTDVSYSSNFSGVPQWDTFVWDQFTWDGRTLSPSEVEMKGTAENYQMTIRSDSDYLYPFTINSTIVHYSMRRRIR